MSNIVKFPNEKKDDERALLSEMVKSAMPSGATAWTVLLKVLRIIRLPVFFVMYWLRLPVIFVCNLISVPMLLAWLFVLYAFPDKTPMLWGFGIMSFTAFVVAWTYDFILMWLSPQDMMRSL